jgi:streptogramin lyase
MNLRYAAAVLVILLAGCGHGSTIPQVQSPVGSASRLLASPDGLTSKNFIGFFTDPSNALPESITTGPDGNLWFTDSFAQLGRLTPTGVITLFPGAYPGPIAPGPGGTLWFESPGNNQICKSSTAGVIKCFTIASDGYFGQVAKGPDGNEWYTAIHSATIGKETPAGTNVEYPLPDAANGAVPWGLVNGPDGNLWFTDVNNTTVMVGKITTTGNITEYPLAPNCNSPLSFIPIVKAKDNNLWVAAQCSGGYVMGSVTTSGIATTYPVGSLVTSLIVGPDKQLWSVTNVNMYEFNVTNQVQSLAVQLAHSCQDDVQRNTSDFLTVGPDGDVWIAGGPCGGILDYEEKITTIGIRLNGELSFTDPNYGFELGYAVGTVSTQTQTISLGMGESVQFKNVDTIPHSAAFLGNATANNAPWPATFTGSTIKSPAGTAIGTTGWATGSLNPNRTSPIYETGLPGFYMIGDQYDYVSNNMRTVIVVH